MGFNSRQILLFVTLAIVLIVTLFMIFIENDGVGEAFTTFFTPNGTSPEATFSDTLNFAEGDNITITGDAGTDTITISATGSAVSNSFATVAGTSGTNAQATSSTDTLTLASTSGTISISGSDPDTMSFDVALADDFMLMGNEAGVGVPIGIPDCTVGNTTRIKYNATFNFFDCDTDLFFTGDITDGTLLPEDLDDGADTPEDEDCLTFEVTGANFEWQGCGVGYTDAEAIAAVEGEATLDLTGSVTIDDNQTFSLGTGGDAQLYYNGTDTFLILRNVGTGDLLVALQAGFPSPDPDSVHIWAGTAGVVDATTDSFLVVENDGNAFVNILTPSTGNAGIRFGDPGSAEVGQVAYNHNNDTLSFRAAGGTRMSITGTAITITQAIIFPSTQNASANANALDDYEEGDWVMSITFGGASAGQTYNGNTGTYVKVGRKVELSGFLRLTAKGSSTGDARLAGLPFPVGTGSKFTAVGSLNLSTVTYTDSYALLAAHTSSTAIFRQISDAGIETTLTHANFADTSIVSMSLTYFTD